MRKVSLCFVAPLLLLSACSSKNYVAPVQEAFKSAKYSLTHYRVRPGDSLYSIAWSYGRNYSKLAELNHLSPPYKLYSGQMLRLRGSSAKKSKKITGVRLARRPYQNQLKNWRWPAIGRVVAGFSLDPYGNKGVNIGGTLGEGVYSAANGVVVYSGAGVRGYGNLIIIKHDKDFLSAYAFNQRNLTKEGMKVLAGQKIATMGRNNAGAVMLHFELRRNGVPVDPLTYLR